MSSLHSPDQFGIIVKVYLWALFNGRCSQMWANIGFGEKIKLTRAQLLSSGWLFNVIVQVEVLKCEKDNQAPTDII